MEHAKHTPGPWWIWKQRAGCDRDELLDDTEHDIYCGEPTECTPGFMTGPVQQITTISDFCEVHEDDETRLANALLVAAAPDLLKVANLAVEVADGSLVKLARAAIAKATA